MLMLILITRLFFTILMRQKNLLLLPTFPRAVLCCIWELSWLQNLWCRAKFWAWDFPNRVRQEEKAYLLCRNVLRRAFLTSQIMQRKENWPLCSLKDNLLFRDSIFMGSSPSLLQKISVDQKSSSDTVGRKGSLVYIKVNAREHCYVLVLP